MFVLSFIVIFGPKKSTKLTYSSVWDFKFYTLIQLMLNSLRSEDFNFTKIVNVYIYRFQYTILTCRTTVYVLFLFWTFFFFFGENLLLVIFNFSTISDTIPSSYFFTFKSHSIFNLSSNSSFLSENIMFFIIFFTFCSFIYLLNLRYSFNYSYFKNLWIFDSFLLLLFGFLFFNFYFLIFIFLIIYFKK
jgi:hypothetical protein